ncbi:MAG TPA: hypothetical protein V6D47_01280 [Oscillatoriaceae cyanobacterium]
MSASRILAGALELLPAESHVTYGSGSYQAMDVDAEEARAVAARAIAELKDEAWLNDPTLQLEELLACERRPALGWAYRMTARVAGSGHTRLIRTHWLIDDIQRHLHQDLELTSRDDQPQPQGLTLTGTWRYVSAPADLVDEAARLLAGPAWLDRPVWIEEVSRAACLEGGSDVVFLETEGTSGGYERRISALVSRDAGNMALLWVRLGHGPIRLPRQSRSKG